jgi:hypothetical protein
MLEIVETTKLIDGVDGAALTMRVFGVAKSCKLRMAVNP